MEDRIYKKPRKPDYITTLSRNLTKSTTETEKILWKVVRGRRIKGLKFRRQAPFGRYIFDFYCEEKKVAIEIDGSSHDNKQEYDYNREELIEACNIMIIHFKNEDILDNIKSVIYKIEKAVF